MQRWKYCKIMVPIQFSDEYDTGSAYLTFLQHDDELREELSPGDVGRMIGRLGMGGWELVAVLQESTPLINQGTIFAQSPVGTLYLFKQPIED